MSISIDLGVSILSPSVHHQDKGDIVRRLSIPDKSLTGTTGTDPTTGWVLDDNRGGAITFGSGSASIPQYSGMYTTVTGLLPDTYYRITLLTAQKPTIERVQLGGGGTPAWINQGSGVYYGYVTTPQTLFNSWLRIDRTSTGAQVITGDIVIEQHSEAVGMKDSSLTTSNVTTSPDTSGDWYRTDTATGAFAGLPRMDGDGIIHCCTGDDNPDTTASLRKDDFFTNPRRIVSRVPYRIGWSAITLGTPGAFWEIGTFISNAGVLNNMTTELYAEGISHSGVSSGGMLRFNSESTSSIDSTYDITGPITVTRGAMPAPAYDHQIDDNAHDGQQGGGTWSSTSHNVIGWNYLPGTPVTNFGVSFENVAIANTATIYRAYLIFNVDTESTAGLFKIGHETQSATSSKSAWGAAHLPAGTGSQSTASVIGTAQGAKVYDVSTVAQAIINDDDFASGDWVNLAFVPTEGGTNIEIEPLSARLIIYTAPGVFS